ncbi:MAG: hypothetical protein KIS96_11780 [Bauldia sp.]|nr:hypothetical protein [Bauldia sp.]
MVETRTPVETAWDRINAIIGNDRLFRMAGRDDNRAMLREAVVDLALALREEQAEARVAAARQAALEEAARLVFNGQRCRTCRTVFHALAGHECERPSWEQLRGHELAGALLALANSGQPLTSGDEDAGVRATSNKGSISPSDPLAIIAGIRQFGLAADGSDLRDLEAAVVRLSTPSDGWLPMESAPRDGTRVLLNDEDTGKIKIGFWSNHLAVWVVDNIFGDDVPEKWDGEAVVITIHRPTAWRPLPAPPAAPVVGE